MYMSIYIHMHARTHAHTHKHTTHTQHTHTHNTHTQHTHTHTHTHTHNMFSYFPIELVYTERTHMKKLKVMLYVSLHLRTYTLCMYVLICKASM